MDGMSALSECYDAFYRALDEAVRKQGPLDGILGFGGTVSQAPCHRELVLSVREIIGKWEEKEKAAEAVRRILWEQQGREDSHAYFTLSAVHAEVLPLISSLSPEEALELSGDYERMLPRRKRLPVQDEVLRQLKKHAGITEKRGWFSRK